MNIQGKIWRDSHGVCHVDGKDREEAFELMGYAHGRDRGMQMLLMRILGQGRTSEFLDSSDEMLEIDKFFRRMNWAGSTSLETAKFSPEARGIADAYNRGANKAFTEKIPWEFKLFGYKPEPWRTEDSVLISRMIGYLTLAQSQGEMERLFIELVQAGIDRPRLDELFPGILGGLDIGLVKKIRLQERIVSPVSLWNIAAPVMMASNNWAVSGRKTASGKPILANDPHLEVNRLPNVWYEIVLKTPERYAMGGTMPGVPAILVGRNPDLAWSATYTFMDSTDSWIEQCKNGSCLREPDKWLKFSERAETIKRKSKDTVTAVFYENDHGVLEGNPFEEGHYIATAWAPSLSGAATFNNFAKMWDAGNVKEGMDILGYVESTWNFVVADTQGNIGYQMSGLMPKRREGVSGFVPLPGWEAQNDWQGFEKPQDLPRCYNPESGYFVTTNQDLNAYGKAGPINVGMGPYRADRISKLLAENNKITREHMYKIQHDVFSTQAESFMKILAPILPGAAEANKLKDWDLEYSADSEEAYIFDRFIKELYRLVFGANGFGSEAAGYLDGHTGIFNDFYINFDRILLSEKSLWFGGRTREELYLQAVETALKGPPKKWGDTRKLVLTNILFNGKLPRFLGFDRGPVTIIGSLATPHQGQIFQSAGRQTSFAPSFRMVTDLATDDIYTNMSGGPSDRRFSKWYCSDLGNWMTGKYKRIGTDPGQEKVPF
jgi:penicillin amidase